MKILTALFVLSCLLAPMMVAAHGFDDDDLYDKVNRKLNEDKDVHGRIKVEVKNAVVTLTGSVHDEKVRSRAEKLAKKVAGVKDVVNKLEIGDEGPPRQ